MNWPGGYKIELVVREGVDRFTQASDIVTVLNTGGFQTKGLKLGFRGPNYVSVITPEKIPDSLKKGIYEMGHERCPC